MLMYVFLSPILSCVVSFLPLYTRFLLFVYNLLFLFHTMMPWWVLFKVFQKYRLSKFTCYKLSSCKVFQEFVLEYILLYSTSEYELSDLWLLSYVHLFVVVSFYYFTLRRELLVWPTDYVGNTRSRQAATCSPCFVTDCQRGRLLGHMCFTC